MSTGLASAARIVLLLTVAGVPLILAPGIQYFDITPKLLLLLGGASLTWLLLALGGRLAVAHQARPLALALAGLALSAALATATSSHRLLSVVGSDWRRLGLPAWLACLSLALAVLLAFRTDAQRRHVAAAVALAAGVAGVYALAQYSGFDPLINPALYHVGEGEWQIVRPPATLGYVSYFATFAVIGGFLALALGMSSARRPWQAAWLFLSLMIGVSVVASGARAGLAGIAAGAVVLVLLSGRRKWLLAGFLAMVVIAAVFIVSPAGHLVRSRLRWFMEDPTGGQRLLIWRDTLRMVAAHPVLGGGPDTYGIEFPHFESLELARRLPDSYIESPHSVLLDYATNVGIAGLACFAVLMFFAISSGARTARSAAGTMAGFDLGILAALVAAFTSSLFVSDTIPTRLALLITAALLVSGHGTGAPAGDPAERRVPQRKAEELAGRRAPSAILAGFLALACFLATAVLGWRMLRADRAALLAARAASQYRFDELLNAGRTAASSFPWTASYAFSYSRVLGQTVMGVNLPPAVRQVLLSEALQSALGAVAVSDRPHVLLVHLASLYALEGRNQEAKELLEQAVTLAPSWYRPRWLLAVLLLSERQNGEAARQAAAALERGARSHPEIALSCVEIQRVSVGRQ